MTRISVDERFDFRPFLSKPDKTWTGSRHVNSLIGHETFLELEEKNIHFQLLIRTKNRQEQKRIEQNNHNFKKKTEDNV